MSEDLVPDFSIPNLEHFSSLGSLFPSLWNGIFLYTRQSLWPSCYLAPSLPQNWTHFRRSWSPLALLYWAFPAINLESKNQARTWRSFRDWSKYCSKPCRRPLYTFHRPLETLPYVWLTGWCWTNRLSSICKLTLTLTYSGEHWNSWFRNNVEHKDRLRDREKISESGRPSKTMALPFLPSLSSICPPLSSLPHDIQFWCSIITFLVTLWLITGMSVQGEDMYLISSFLRKVMWMVKKNRRFSPFWRWVND